MDPNILFRWIWRLNAVLLLAALSLLALFSAPHIWQTLQWEYGNRGDGYTIYAAGSGPGSTRLRDSYGLSLDFQRTGRRETVLVLAPVHPYPQIDESGIYQPQARADYSQVANYLFVDPTTGNSRWLFPSNNQTITSTDYVYDSGIPVASIPAVLGSNPARAVLYDVRPAGAPNISSSRASSTDPISPSCWTTWINRRPKPRPRRTFRFAI